MVIDDTVALPPEGLAADFLDRTNLSREEAAVRSALVALRDYDVHVDLSTALDPEAAGFRSTTTLRFDVVEAEDDAEHSTGAPWTFLDFLNAGVESVVLNGRALDVAEVAGSARILLPGLAARNEVTVTGTALYSTSGEGMHRFTDPGDGLTYLYTQYEPADARRVFACFEQPDLKAAFTFHLTGPADWVLASNQPETARRPAGVDGVGGQDLVTVDFAPTPPLSTYITTLLAGPYARWDGTWDGHPASGAGPVPLTLYCRASLADALDPEAILATTRAGLDFFHDLFGVPYPWGGYAQAFVPEYNLGAMENPGLVTFTEHYVFTSRATQAQYEARATTILHEMAHMWFGDLVTMRWWDDLWLKESFADYMGTLAAAEATEHTGAWTTFANRRKGWAYVQDAYPTTHPIVADIPDLEAARQNFDGITYAKGAAVLKQLAAFVGRERFVEAARIYFRRHAFGNATLADFTAALGEASGREVDAWVGDWLRTSGSSELWVEDGALRHAGTDPVTGAEVLRPHVLTVGTYRPDDVGRLVRTAVQEVDVPAGNAGRSTALSQAEPGPDGLILPNDEDHTYARVRLDPDSLQAALRYPVADSLARASVWASLWTMTRDGELAAEEFVGAACRLAGVIDDVGTYARVLDQAEAAVTRYAPARRRGHLRVLLATSLVEALRATGDGSDRQRAAARTLTRLARGAEGESVGVVEPVLRALVTEPQGMAPGLVADAEIRWAGRQGLAALGLVSRQQLDEALAADHSAETAVWHRTATAALPEPAGRRAAWEAVLSGRDADGTVLSNDHLSATAAGVQASRPDLTEPLLDRYWPALEAIWADRSNGLASRTIGGLFPSVQDAVPGGPEAQEEHPVLAAAQQWLDAHTAAPRALRRELTELTDDLRRSLRAQALTGQASQTG